MWESYFAAAARLHGATIACRALAAVERPACAPSVTGGHGSAVMNPSQFRSLDVGRKGVEAQRVALAAVLALAMPSTQLAPLVLATVVLRLAQSPEWCRQRCGALSAPPMRCAWYR